MIIDSSAIVAVINDEPEAAELVRVVEARGHVQVSAATLLETSIVLGGARHEHLDRWLSRAGVEIVPFDAEQARIARRAYVAYGKGSGSPARLNYGDCFSYALAKASGRPLLFKGDDFGHTDVESAYRPM